MTGGPSLAFYLGLWSLPSSLAHGLDGVGVGSDCSSFLALPEWGAGGAGLQTSFPCLGPGPSAGLGEGIPLLPEGPVGVCLSVQQLSWWAFAALLEFGFVSHPGPQRLSAAAFTLREGWRPLGAQNAERD